MKIYLYISIALCLSMYVKEFSAETSFEGMSCLANNIIPWPLVFLFTPRPSIISWSMGKLSSSFVSETFIVNINIWFYLSHKTIKIVSKRIDVEMSNNSFINLRLRSTLSFSLELKLASDPSITQLLGLCKIDCQWIILALILFDNILVPI